MTDNDLSLDNLAVIANRIAMVREDEHREHYTAIFTQALSKRRRTPRSSMLGMAIASQRRPRGGGKYLK